jgi:hypothetical protein
MREWHRVMVAHIHVILATRRAFACLYRIKTYNIRQNLVFVYVGKGSASGKSQVSGYSIVSGTVLATATLVNVNPFEPTQASFSARSAV